MHQTSPARQKLFDVTTFYAGYVLDGHVFDVHEKGLSGIIIRFYITFLYNLNHDGHYYMGWKKKPFPVMLTRH